MKPKLYAEVAVACPLGHQHVIQRSHASLLGSGHLVAVGYHWPVMEEGEVPYSDGEDDAKAAAVVANGGCGDEMPN